MLFSMQRLVTLSLLSSLVIPAPLLAQISDEKHESECALWGPSGLVSTGGSSATARFYPLTDQQGSVRFLTDSSGNVVRSYTYTPYGTATTTTSSASTTPYQYTNENFDSETGLTYLRARYYDPTVGRFISRDPVRGTLDNPITQDPYIYGASNPTTYTDPSGEFVPLLIIGGLALAAFLTNPMIESPCAVMNPTPEDFARAEQAGQFFFVAGFATPGGMQAKGFNLVIKHGHAIQHLIEGFTAEIIDAAIRRDVIEKGAGALGQTLEREIQIGGETLIYRIHTWAEGQVNVGTYFFK